MFLYIVKTFVKSPPLLEAHSSFFHSKNAERCADYFHLPISKSFFQDKNPFSLQKQVFDVFPVETKCNKNKTRIFLLERNTSKSSVYFLTILKRFFKPVRCSRSFIIDNLHSAIDMCLYLLIVYIKIQVYILATF